MGKIPSVQSGFKRSIQQKELLEQLEGKQAEIDCLLQTIEQLQASNSEAVEGRIDEFRDILKDAGGEHQIAITDIDPNPNQPRQTLTNESIKNIASSLERDGQIVPIILIPTGERYLIWDGYRRYQGAKYLGWNDIRAVFSPMPENLHRSALLTFIHHEDLNILDKASAIVREISHNANLPEIEVALFLSSLMRKLKRQDKYKEIAELIGADAIEVESKLRALEMNETEVKVLATILDLGLNPASVDNNIISVLSLFEDLKQAIRERELKPNHALALRSINSVKLRTTEDIATTERMKAIDRVISEQMTIAQTREMVTKIIEIYTGMPKTISQPIVKISHSLESLNSEILGQASTQELKELKKILNQKLTEVREAIKLSSADSI